MAAQATRRKDSGLTGLLLCLAAEHDSPEAVELLLDAKANVDRGDDDQR